MVEERRIRVVVADDHTLFREGLTALLQAEAGTEVVGSASSGSEALTQVAETGPDVVLMDIMMPDINGIDAARRVHDEHPATRVVMLTMLEDDDSLFAAMRAGAHGYLLKGADTDAVLRTLRAVAGGEAVFGPAIAERLTGFFQRGPETSAQPFPELTHRERDVLDLMAAGHDNAQIARRLVLSGKTVSNYVSTIFAKLHLADRSQAIVAAREAGLGKEPP